MATKPSVQKNTGLFAVFFCVTAVLLGYTYYLIQTNQHLDVQAIALAPNWYQLKPHWAKKIVAEGGYVGTLSAVLLIMFQGLLYCGGAFVAAYFGLKFLEDKPALDDAMIDPEAKRRKGVNSAEIHGSVLQISLPEYPGAKKGKMLGGSIDTNPYKQDFYRIEQAHLSIREGVVLTTHKKLYMAIYAMLKAHPDVPASIGGHHADAPLFEHSLSVAKKMQAYFAEQGKTEPLAAIAGLAHDMDKLLAYKKSGDTWGKNKSATHHNKFAAYIVSTQPEFHELPEDERSALVLSLRYYHDPDDLPIGASNRTEALMQALRICDGLVIKEEKVAGVASVTDEQLESIEKALLDTISELNINCYLSKSEHAGGWTTPALEYVITPMSTVLELMGRHLPSELNKKLQLDHETRTFTHPAAKLVCRRLEKMGLLMTTYKSFSSEMGLYNCRIGTAGFKAVLMLQKSVLEQLTPGLQAKWGEPSYRVRITGALDDMSVQGASDVDGEPE